MITLDNSSNQHPPSNMADVADSAILALPATHDDVPVALFKKRGAKKSSNIRKRPATPPPASDSSSGDEYSSEDEVGRKIKRRRKNGISVTSSAPVRNDTTSLSATKFDADKSATIQVTQDATRQSNWYDESAKDALSAKNLLGSSSVRPRTDDTSNNGSYKGTKGYSNFIEKNPNAPTRQLGPVKAPTNIRTITVTDFAPDVCKDYKQTGFCGFGDNCKFLHAREDYKQGWELDRDWEVGTKGKKIQGKTVASANRSGGTGNDDEDADDALLESIPFACFICKDPYKNPIVTKCGHYFCEKCALDKYRKSPACAACGSGTGGVFNGAKNLKRLLERKRERIQKNKEKAREAGEEVSSDEEGDEA